MFSNSKKTLKLYGSFLWMEFNWKSRLESLQGGSLLFTTKFPEIPSRKGCVDIEATQWF